MENVLHNLRYGLRMLRKAPAVSAVAIFSLALGIGANATILTWVRSILLRPIAGVEEPERLVLLMTETAAGVRTNNSVPDFRGH